MAIGDYVIDLPQFPEVHAGQLLVFVNVWLKVQTGEGPVAYASVKGGHRDVPISAPAVIQIADGPGTDAQKRAAVIALVEDEVKSWGIVESDAAMRAFLSILPGEEWPEGGYQNLPLDLS